MSREICRENFSLLLFVALGASTQRKDIWIGSLHLIVHQNSAVYFQACIHRQLDIRAEAHRDHYKISRRFFTVCEAHGLHAPIAQHRGNFPFHYRDIAAALAQSAPNFSRQPTANHHRARPRRRCVNHSPGFIQSAEDEHAVFVQAFRGRNHGARSSGQNQFVVAGPIPVARPHRAAQAVDLLDADSQARPDSVLLIPFDIVQDDAVEVALAGQHASEQCAVVVGVGFIAKNGDVENLPALEKLFHAGHRGHSVAHED